MKGGGASAALEAEQVGLNTLFGCDRRIVLGGTAAGTSGGAGGVKYQQAVDEGAWKSCQMHLISVAASGHLLWFGLDVTGWGGGGGVLRQWHLH